MKCLTPSAYDEENLIWGHDSRGFGLQSDSSFAFGSVVGHSILAGSCGKEQLFDSRRQGSQAEEKELHPRIPCKAHTSDLTSSYLFRSPPHPGSTTGWWLSLQHVGLWGTLEMYSVYMSDVLCLHVWWVPIQFLRTFRGAMPSQGSLALGLTCCSEAPACDSAGEDRAMVYFPRNLEFCTGKGWFLVKRELKIFF